MTLKQCFSTFIDQANPYAKPEAFFEPQISSSHKNKMSHSMIPCNTILVLKTNTLETDSANPRLRTTESLPAVANQA